MTENDAIKTLKIMFANNSIGMENKQEVLEAAIQALEEIQQCRAIGTVEEFKDLKEKAESKKPIRKSDINGKYEEVTCPNCDRFVDDYTNKKYCNCGQALDWR